MPIDLSRRNLLALAPAMFGSGVLAGCANDPRMVKQDEPPANLRTGKAYVAVDVHEFVTGVLSGRNYSAGATFTNVASPKTWPFFPADQWALLSTTGRHHPEHIIAIEAGTYRLAFLGIEQAATSFDVATSPLEFTVSPGELVYLGAVEWHREKTSTMLDYQPRYRFEFSVSDELETRRAALQQEIALLPGNPQMQTRLMTVRTASMELQGHRPSLW